MGFRLKIVRKLLQSCEKLLLAVCCTRSLSRSCNGLACLKDLFCGGTPSAGDPALSKFSFARLRWWAWGGGGGAEGGGRGEAGLEGGESGVTAGELCKISVQPSI